MKEPYITLNRAIDDLSKGKMIILQDSADRENEGDILFFASKADREKIGFTVNKARGLLCVALSPQKAEKLDLSLMCADSDSPHGTAFTQSVDAREGVSTGISISDRLATVEKLGQPTSSANDFHRPGHVFPLIAHPKGLSFRQGHTEASVELARRAGEEEAVAICEILGKGDSMARGQELIDFAMENQLGILTIETIMECIAPSAEIQLSTEYGVFTMFTYGHEREHPAIALVAGDLSTLEDPLIRIHSECLTGDLFGSKRCDCGEQKERSLHLIQREGGVFIYLRQEGRGIGLVEKLKAYGLQDGGMDTVDANLALGYGEDDREYLLAVRILKSMGCKSVRLLTNNPSKIAALRSNGLTVKRIPLEIPPEKDNFSYLETKKQRMSHLLTLER